MIAAQRQSTTPLPVGHVRLIDGDRCTIRLEQGGDVIARQAASCLLQPQPTDRVLLTLSPEPFILAVLERDSEQTADIKIAGDARIHATGKLDLDAPRAVSIRSQSSVDLATDTFRLHSRRTEIAAELLIAVAQVARGSFESAAVVGQQLDVIADRIVQKAARVYRTITEFDQVRARHFDYRADGNARISAQSAVITAREVVKMDGEQVHIG